MQELFFANFGGRYRNRTGIKGFAVLCISHSANRPSKDGCIFTRFFLNSQEKNLFFYLYILILLC